MYTDYAPYPEDLDDDDDGIIICFAEMIEIFTRVVTACYSGPVGQWPIYPPTDRSGFDDVAGYPPVHEYKDCLYTKMNTKQS